MTDTDDKAAKKAAKAAKKAAKKAKKVEKKAQKKAKKAAKKAAKKKPRAIPKEREGVTPYLAIKGAAAALEFYKKAFGATEHERIPGPEGKVVHAEMKIGKAMFMFSDEFPEMGHKSPKTLGGTPVSLYIYVENVDALFAQAKAAGAIVKKECQDQFYGDRSCALEDPFGHSWGFATHIEDVSKEELAKRASAAAQHADHDKAAAAGAAASSDKSAATGSSAAKAKS